MAQEQDTHIEPVLSSAEVAELAGVSPQTVSNWHESGKLHRIPMMGPAHYRKSEVDALLRERAMNGQAATNGEAQKVEPAPIEGELLTTTEAAQLAGTTIAQVRHGIKSGTLKVRGKRSQERGQGRPWNLFDRGEVEEWGRKRATGEIPVQAKRRPPASRTRRQEQQHQSQERHKLKRRAQRAAQGNAVDQALLDLEGALADGIDAIKRLREAERTDIEQKTRARLAAFLSRPTKL